MTTASTGNGTDELWTTLAEHRSHLVRTGEMAHRRERQLLDELRGVMVSRIEQNVLGAGAGARYEEVAAALVRRELDPYDAASRLLEPED